MLIDRRPPDPRGAWPVDTSDGRGSSQADVRQHNRGLALALVAQRRSMTRANLAEAIGLTRPAVSRIVGDLIGAGLITESEPRPGSGPGRPTGHLSLPREQHLFFGVDLRLEGVLIQARDLAGNLLSESRHALPRNASAETAVELVADQVKARSAELGLPTRGVGLAVGAHQDQLGQVVIESMYRPWRGVPLPRLIGERLGPDHPPVVMSDVASCAALANWQELATDPALDDLVHLQIGIGSGSGLVQRRQGIPQVVRSARIAHLPLQADGPRCVCGARGCFDAVAGFWALVERAAATGLVPTEGPGMIEDYCVELAARADGGDQHAEQAIEEMASSFAHVAAMLINIVQPSRFTYAGYPVQLGPRFHRHFVDVLSPYVEDLGAILVTTPLGDRASVIGAYWLATRHLMADPEHDLRQQPTSTAHSPA